MNITAHLLIFYYVDCILVEMIVIKIIDRWICELYVV